MVVVFTDSIGIALFSTVGARNCSQISFHMTTTWAPPFRIHSGSTPGAKIGKMMWSGRNGVANELLSYLMRSKYTAGGSSGSGLVSMQLQDRHWSHQLPWCLLGFSYQRQAPQNVDERQGRQQEVHKCWWWLWCQGHNLRSLHITLYRWLVVNLLAIGRGLQWYSNWTHRASLWMLVGKISSLCTWRHWRQGQMVG